jgi:hypothetical protein
MNEDMSRKTSGWAHLAFGLAVLLGDLLGAGPKLRPVLTFTTRTRNPVLVGVPELVPTAAKPSASPRYYRRLAFSGERQAATGEVLGRPNECPGVSGSAGISPRQTRRQLRGEILYVYDPVTDAAVLTHAAREHTAIVTAPPWPANSCNPPASPLPLGFPVPGIGRQRALW